MREVFDLIPGQSISWLAEFLIKENVFVEILVGLIAPLSVCLTSFFHNPKWDVEGFDFEDIKKVSIVSYLFSLIASVSLAFFTKANPTVIGLFSSIFPLLLISVHTDFKYHRVDRHVSRVSLLLVSIIATLAFFATSNPIKWNILMVSLILCVGFFQKSIGLADVRAILITGVALTTLHTVSLGIKGENVPIGSAVLIVLAVEMVAILVRSYIVEKDFRKVFSSKEQVPMVPGILSIPVSVLLYYLTMTTFA